MTRESLPENGSSSSQESKVTENIQMDANIKMEPAEEIGTPNYPEQETYVVAKERLDEYVTIGFVDENANVIPISVPILNSKINTISAYLSNKKHIEADGMTKGNPMEVKPKELQNSSIQFDFASLPQSMSAAELNTIIKPLQEVIYWNGYEKGKISINGNSNIEIYPIFTVD
jgi:hypothetical protein